MTLAVPATFTADALAAASSAWYASDVTRNKSPPNRGDMKFSEWTNQQDIELAHWEPVEKYDLWGNDVHEHELVPYTPEETDVIIERYLRNILKIYGDQPAASHICVFNCPEEHPIDPDAGRVARERLEEIRKNKPL